MGIIQAYSFWPRLALGVWGVIVFIALGRAAFHHHPRHIGCYPVFADTGRHWLHGQTLYEIDNPNYMELFRYSPLVAAGLTPLAWFPDPVGSALLRLVNLAVFLPGLWWWGRTALPRALTAKYHAILFLLVALLGASPLVDVQLNILTIGLLLIAMAAVSLERWNLAALTVSLAVLIKAYPIAVALLLAVLYPRRFAPRWLGAMALCLALPFVLQRPAYVLEQYQDWVFCLTHQPHPDGFFQDMMLFANLWLLSISRQTYTWIEVATGAGVALICLVHQRRGMPRQGLLNTTFALGGAWMMALGPATEATTYVMIAPAAAAAMLLAWSLPQPGWFRAMISVSFGVFLLAQLQLFFDLDRPLHRVAAQPFAALLFMVPLAVRGLGDVCSGRLLNRHA